MGQAATSGRALEEGSLMPMLPKLPCRVAGCPVLGPCAKHARPVVVQPDRRLGMVGQKGVWGVKSLQLFSVDRLSSLSRCIRTQELSFPPKGAL